MNTAQILTLLIDDEYASALTPRVLARDQFAPRSRADGVFVVNTDPSDLPGQHWLAISIRGDEVSFFDTYGRALSSFPDLGRVIDARTIVSNSVCVQGLDTNVCGDYCVYVCCLLARGWSLPDVVVALVGNTTSETRDHAVREFCARRLPNLEETLDSEKYRGIGSVHVQHSLPFFANISRILSAFKGAASS